MSLNQESLAFSHGRVKNSTSEILIVGGGIIGLAIAVDLQLRGAKVTLLVRDIAQAASRAAAGMLAPHAEGIPPGPFLDLCYNRAGYIQNGAAKSRIYGYKQRLLSLRYSCSRYELDQPVTTEEVNKIWLDSNAVHLYQPGLGKDVVGGWWYPDDGQVDNRQLVTALQQAAENLGVEIRQGIEVHAIQQKQGKVKSIYTSIGELEAKIYILATGSWAINFYPSLSIPSKVKWPQ